MISLFAEKDNQDATQVIYEQLQPLQLPEGITLSIDNTDGAKSAVYFRNGQPAKCLPNSEGVIRNLMAVGLSPVRAELFHIPLGRLQTQQHCQKSVYSTKKEQFCQNSTKD